MTISCCTIALLFWPLQPLIVKIFKKIVDFSHCIEANIWHFLSEFILLCTCALCTICTILLTLLGKSCNAHMLHASGMYYS